MDANPNLSPAVTHQPSLLGGAENMKLLFDDTMSFLTRNRGNNSTVDNAWNAFNLQVAHDAQVVKHLAQLNVVTSAQTGQTENQQTVSPAGTAESEAAKGGVAVSAEQVAANIAALSDVVTKLSDAMSAVLEAAAGNATGTAKGAS